MNKKALVVEDDSNIAELLRLYLQKDGFSVHLAADGGEGIRLAQELQPDLILLPGTKSTIEDLRWLRQSGLEAAIQEAIAASPKGGSFEFDGVTYSYTRDKAKSFDILSRYVKVAD